MVRGPLTDPRWPMSPSRLDGDAMRALVRHLTIAQRSDLLDALIKVSVDELEEEGALVAVKRTGGRRRRAR